MLIVAFVLLFATIVFATGLFAYPRYSNDEGIYMSQAWAVLHEHKLSPYTYWYDHAPLGWIIIAGWLAITGGIKTFGFSINSGRAFMLVVHVLSVFLLMVLAERLTRKRIAGYVSGLIFAASPLVTFYGRQVLLDNIMVVLLLASLVFLVREERGLGSTILSAVLFAASVLSKETAIVFLPVLVGIAWWRASSRRTLHVGVWVSIVILLLSLYPVFAVVKGEFLPNGDTTHVTFVDAVLFQLHRQGGPIWDPSSPFRTSLADWWELDPILIAMAGACLVALLIASLRSKPARAAWLLLAFPVAFLARGGLVIEFYVLAAAPFIALGFAVLLAEVLGAARSRALAIVTMVLVAGIVVVMAVPLSMSVRTDQSLYTSNQTGVQRQAIEDIIHNGTASQAYLINAYGLTDILAANISPVTGPEVEWYVKVETDKTVQQRFAALSQGRELRFEISEVANVVPYTARFQYLAPAWNMSIRNSTLRHDGWEVATFVEHTPSEMLRRTYPTILTHVQNGRVVVPYDPNATLAQPQALMMLVSVLQGDEPTFKQVWGVTRSLEYPSGSLDWKLPESPVSGQNDLSSDPAAEIMAARALLLAYEQWNETSYRDSALHILDGIWKNDVTYAADGLPYLKAANYAADNETIQTEPSAFDPEAFALFERYDRAHPWRTLEYTQWRTLDACTFELGYGALPPDACSVSNVTGAVSAQGVTEPDGLEYGFAASRGLELVSGAALDGNAQARRYVDEITALRDDWGTRGSISTSYSHGGAPLSSSESVVYYAPALVSFAVSDPYKATEVYEKKILPQYHQGATAAYWEDKNNTITQLWTWLAVYDYARSTTSQ